MNKEIKLILGILVLFVCLFASFTRIDDKEKSLEEHNVQIMFFNLVGMNINEAVKYASNNGVSLNVSYKYSYDVDKDIIISESDVNNNVMDVIVSKGILTTDIYRENKVNELGKVPIMMYHGIVDVKDTKYIGGNVDKDGYNRTTDAFREDLEFYYNKGYRMIRLNDYVDGVIDVDLGYSPIVLTFDDGNENNLKVLGEENGELVIDPNCAVGILEEFKKKYPDYGVTATFFVNGGKFNQEKYDDKILKWLVNHGYDIGNHTVSHVDFTNVDDEVTKREIGGLYQILEEILDDDYVNIVALPFGSPYKVNHNNYKFILNGDYKGVSYTTKAVLRVGWEADYSPFNKDFEPTFLKRIRAYDNNGKDFDIEMNFKLLENTRYISDGDKDVMVILEKDKDKVNEIGNKLRKILY